MKKVSVSVVLGGRERGPKHAWYVYDDKAGKTVYGPIEDQSGAEICVSEDSAANEYKQDNFIIVLLEKSTGKVMSWTADDAGSKGSPAQKWLAGGNKSKVTIGKSKRLPEGV